MKRFLKFTLIAALVACITAPTLSITAHAEKIVSTPTNYTSSENVEYVKKNGYLLNWGARGEDCTFLSQYAEAFYVGEYAYSLLSQNDGGTSRFNAPTSELYAELQSMMQAKHKKITDYQETRPMYCYTDCQHSDNTTISSFYSGKSLSGVWDSGKTWNREHTWPNSKGLAGSDENDIMMLRPTSVSENSSRGNKAYGESSGYFDPGESVRGDCARIVLYVYTRWENTQYMWGTSGVIESVDILLKWMEEDPVDTWEMGRNDAVQAITGTRNAFVDYPEYAWLLFGEEVPTTLTTPSGLAKRGEAGGSTGQKPEDNPPVTPPVEEETGCQHEYGDWYVVMEATETTDGERWRTCSKCKEFFVEAIPKTGGLENDEGCSATIVSPMAVTLFLVAPYVFLRKKREK